MNVKDTSPTMIWYAPRWLALDQTRKSKASRVFWVLFGLVIVSAGIALVGGLAR